MSRKKLDFRADAYRHVLGFVFHHWSHRPALVGFIIVLVIASTLAEVMVPVFSGRIVDAIAGGDAADQALRAFVIVVALGLTSVALRWFIFNGIIRLTLKTMADVTNNGFHKVQRFSTDWHANSFAGSTVRKITRGMWALDSLNDLLLIALLPSLVMLVGATIVLGSYWPVMGLIVGLGSLIYVGVTVGLSMGYVSPAARLANAWDTRLGGALADAISCNSVVKAFGAETREETRLGQVLVKWDNRTRRTWKRGTINGTIQSFMMVSMQAGILGTGLICGDRGSRRRATSPSCWPCSSCCRDICGTWGRISATCSAPSTIWKSWCCIPRCRLASRAGRMRNRFILEKARSFSITSPSNMARTPRRFMMTSQSP